MTWDFKMIKIFHIVLSSLTFPYFFFLDTNVKGGDAGCQCLTGMNSIENIDHLIMTTEDGQFLNCLCGNFQQEWLPVSLRSWTPIKLVYSIAKYSWSTKGFTYKYRTISSPTECVVRELSQHNLASFTRETFHKDSL